MADRERDPLDLVAFFGLSEDEARSLGLEKSTRDQAPRDHATARIFTRPDPEGSWQARDPEGSEVGTNIPAPTKTPQAAHDAMPERAESLPWPSEAEMLAAEPVPDPAFDMAPPPPGVRQWVAVPVTPVRDPLEEILPPPVMPFDDDPATWPATSLDAGRGAPFASPPPADEPAAPAPDPLDLLTGVPDLPSIGSGPYGLTGEQIAELGPDILRDLDRAMAEQLATMPLRMMPEAAIPQPPSPPAEPSARADAEMPAAPLEAVIDLPKEAPPLAPPPDGEHAGAPRPEAPAQPAAVAEPPGTAASSPPSQSFAGLAGQLLDVFMDEALEMLDGLHASLELLERGPSDGAVIEARRTVHTIKGGARMCGLKAITLLAHACEDAIGQPSAGQTTLPPTLVPLLFQAEQEMRAALARPASGPGSDASLAALAERLRTAAAHRPPSSARLRVDLPPTPPRPTAPAQPARAMAGSAAARPSEDPRTPSGRLAPASIPDGAVPVPQPAPARLNERSMLLRRPAITSVSPQGNRLAVDLNKVEGMVAKVTEIVANRAASHGLVDALGSTVAEVMHTVHRLQSITVALQYQIASHGLDSAPEQDPDGLALETYGPIRQLMLQLAEAVSDQQALVQATMDIVTNKRALAAIEDRLDTDLQGALLNMRLLPLSQLRVRLDQVVRSAAATAGREVRWVMEGQNVALDKHVCDRLFEPLMHLLRNAIDHGIEPPAEREARGKPRVGRIVVQAAVEGNQAVVSVSDDGRGMDPERIAAAAVERGVVRAEHARLLGPREKLELVFRPGFSTASAVTELSGRGMGMEIVREACSRMGGTVSIAPRPGGGTIVTLQVPLSMSVVHALIVRDAGRVLAIPASQVLSVHLVRPAAITAREHGHAVRIGHDEMRLYRLPAAPSRAGAARGAEELSVLVIPHHGERVALAIDEMVNEDDLIVKPLPVLLQGVERLLGAIILPDGVPAPVLNLPPLLDHILSQGGEVVPEPSVPAPAEQIILVVDDSLTMRMALSQGLEHAGYTVLTARDGQEALELIRVHGLPSLVTLDIEMPRMDGLETLFAIRQMPGGAAVPIFILTSRGSQKHKRTALKMGATRYFTKPYHDSEFLAAVQAAIAARHFSPPGSPAYPGGE